MLIFTSIKQSNTELTPSLDTLSDIYPALLLEATVFTRKQLIYPEAPQIALAGRSNVGKSSLINALAGRKTLAKVSATPGKTRSINYYQVGATNTYLVDLPGYGYAQCSKTEQNKWEELLRHYLTYTPGLRALALLIDPRRLPQKSDRELLDFAASVSLLILPVLSKADKCGKNGLKICQRAWEPLLGQNAKIITSARNKSGLHDMWQAVLRLLLKE
jgi:GTP-binding protein